MNSIPLEITIKSANILKNVNFFNRKNIYTIVSLITNDSISTHKTNIDHHNGSQPYWCYKMKFNVDESKIDENSCMLVIQVRCKGTLGDKDIGFLYIPVRELFHGREVYSPKDVAYMVSTSSGKPKGILYLSYEFGEKIVRVKRSGEEIIRVSTPSAPPCCLLEDDFPASETNHLAPSAPLCEEELEGRG